MAIIAIIAAAVLGTARAAMEAGRRDRTRATIAKINGLIMERWAGYETRRVELGQPLAREVSENYRSELQSIGADGPGRALAARQYGERLSDLRLIALRELMKYEMPDRWSDVVVTTDSTGAVQLPIALDRPPALALAYQRRYVEALNNADQETVQNLEGPETLYQIVMQATGDGESRTLFTEQDLGDVDGDGLPELLDGWGRPISWVRWAPGFVSRSEVMTGDGVGDHDPFDPFRRHQPPSPQTPSVSSYPSSVQPYVARLRANTTLNPVGFRLAPLIYSAGADQQSDLDSASDYAVTDRNGNLLLDPWATDPDGLSDLALVDPSTTDPFEYGIPTDDNDDGEDNSLDNIHNQLIE